MRQAAIVVLSKYADLFNRFKRSVDTFLPNYTRVLVRDGEEIALPLDSRWIVTQGPEKFAMAVNGSLGMKTAPEDHDVLYCGDDIEFSSSDTLEVLQRDAYSDPRIGLISPKILGAVGSNVQANPTPGIINYTGHRLAFPCVYIKREVFDSIGYLDPIFSGTYGYDDDDFCYRAQLAGFKLAVTPYTSVYHRHAATTFTRAGLGGVGPGDDCRTGEAKFIDKWGPDVFAKIAALGGSSPTPPPTPVASSNSRIFRRPLR